MTHHTRIIALALAVLTAACTEAPLDVKEQLATSSPSFSSSASTVVTTLADAGSGSLRQTILDAPIGVTTSITFAPGLSGSSITLASELSISGKSIHINAAPGRIVIDGNNATRVFNVLGDGALELTNVTVQRGRAAPSGGGILNAGTTLLNNSTVRWSVAERTGGGIYSSGDLTLNNSHVSENSFYQSNFFKWGAGLYVISGTATANNTTFHQNKISPQTGDGAAIVVQGGTYHMNGGTISGDVVTFLSQNATGILVREGGTAFLDRITVQSMRASGPYGPIFVDGGTVTLTRSFIRHNTVQSGGGIVYLKRGTLTANYNRFFSQQAAAMEGGTGNWDNNYWNCNAGPNGGGSCYNGIGITPATWLMVNLTATPAAIDPFQSSALEMDITRNSAGQPIALSNLNTMMGMGFEFVNTTKGTVAPGAVVLNASGEAGAKFTSNGETGRANVTARSTDSGQFVRMAVSQQIQVGPENAAPIARAGDDQTLQCTGATTSALLSGSTSSDPDGNALTYEWLHNNSVIFTGVSTTRELPLGLHTFTLRVGDGSLQSTDDVAVNIIDTQAPVVSLNGAAEVDVEVGSSYTDAGATALDACAGPLTVQMGGSVNTSVVGDYTITYNAVDPSGLNGSASRIVHVGDTQAPVISLNGSEIITLELGFDTYVELGATATDNGSNIPVVISGSVNPGAVGTYTITYTATDASGNSSSVTRTVIVQDTRAPVITLNGSAIMTLELGVQSYAEAGATATDVPNPNPTITISGAVNAQQLGTYVLTYSAVDPSGNRASVTRTVHVVDTQAPVITLHGSPFMTLEQGTAYVEPGATATDNSGSAIVQIAGTVNTNVLGTYTITYTAQDQSGNRSSAARTVHVVDTNAPVITVDAAPLVIWPPNHKYVTVSLAALDISVSEGSASSMVITKVTSDEADNGLGDGDTANDMVVSSDGRSVQLRAERSGKGNGRVYVLHLGMKDAAGNVGSAQYRVSVPKNQKQGAVADAVANEVNGRQP